MVKVGRSSILVAAAAALLSIPAIFVGFLSDDLIHRLTLKRAWPGYRRDALSLYDFLNGGPENAELARAGLLPWFADPELAARFFRPLSSLTLALDYRLFGDSALLAHLHSLVWFALVVFFTWKIQRALLPERVANLATLVFAIAGSHVDAMAWIASRHVLVSAAFALAAWYASIRWQDTRRPLFGAVSAALLLAAFGASEAALTVVPFLLGQAWFGSAAPVRERLGRAALPALISLGYLLAYALFGYGTRRAGTYVSPFESPLRFAAAVFERLPVLASELFTSYPSILSYASSEAHWIAWALGLASGGLVCALVLWRRAALGAHGRHVPWLLAAFGASLVPLCATALNGRAMAVPMVASSIFVGALLSRQLRAPAPSLVRRAAGVLGLALLVLSHLVFSPFRRVAAVYSYHMLSDVQRTMRSRARLACREDARVFLINGSDPTIGPYSAAAFLSAGEMKRPGWHILSMAPHELELVREAERSYALRVIDRPRRTHFGEELYRPLHKPLEVGDRVALDGVSVSVLETEPNGVTRARFELDPRAPLDAACFIRWTGGLSGHFESVALPVHGVLRVPYVPGLLGI